MARKNIRDNYSDAVQPSDPIDVLASTVVETDANVVETQTEVPEASQPHSDIQVQSNGSNLAALEATNAELRAALEQAHQREAATVAELRTALEQAHQHEAAIVAELRAGLEKAHQREYELQENVYQLKSEVFEQKSLVQKLEQALDQANMKIKNELDEAKKTALELAQANAKLIEELKGVKVQKEEPPTPKAIVPKKQMTIPKKSVPIIIEKLPPEKPGEPSTTSSPMWLLD
jgi:chromosome segregation ATPase